MCLKILLRLLIGVVVVQLNFLGSSLFAQTLLNVDFGVGTNSSKVGVAATGQSADDYWNLYSRDDGSGGYRTVGAVSNLKRADGTVSAVGLSVINAPGAWQNGAADPMYNVYLYPFDGGNITVTVTNLPAGSYDVFLYGHGGPGVGTANSVFQVVSGSSDYGTKATTTTSGWTSPVWQEGQQYVVFRDVAVANAGGSVTVTVFPGAYGQAFISGMQVVEKSSTPPLLPPVAGTLLNVDFGAGTNSAKVGSAATGQNTNDYWNLYSRDDGRGGYRTVGAVSNLKWADGTVSAVGLTVTNAPGAWHNGTADPMYDVYLYPFNGGIITVTASNLPVGSYDLFLYGHGGPGVDSANSVFQVVSGSRDYGRKATTTTSGWTSPVWQEGQQYVVFRDVAVVNAGGSLTVTVFPGVYGQAFISGMQAVQRSPTPPPTGCVTPFSGLVGWWKGNGDATDAVGSNNGALVGNASFSPGMVGQAFSFDGDNDSVMIGNPAALQLQNFTIEAWIKRGSTNKASLDVVLVGHIFGYGYGGYVFALLEDGRLTLGQVGLSGVNSTMSIRDTNWHHVAVSKASGAVAFYVDGVGEAAPQYNPGFYFISSVQIGASQWDGTRPTGSFLGLIDEVSIYSRGLSSSEIQALFNAGSSGKCPPSSLPVTAFANGSFESPALAPGASVNLPAGSTTLTGWVVGHTGLVSWRNGPAYGVAPIDGSQEIGFNGADTPPGGSISQTFSTAIGQTYELRFNVGRQGPGSGMMKLSAQVTSGTGEVLGSFTGVAPDSPGYGPVQIFNFTASTSSSTLTFTDTSSATVAVDLLLDNVRVGASTGTCVTPSSGLVSWWRAEGNAVDSAGANNGGLAGGVAFTDGIVGQAFSFDGVDDSVVVPASPNLSVGSLTLETWINPAGLTQARPLFEYASAAGNVGAHFWINVNPSVPPYIIPGTLFANLRTANVPGDTGNRTIASAANLLKIHEWQHVALTYDQPSGQTRIYLNGSVVASANLGSAPPATGFPLNLGRRPPGVSETLGGADFAGAMDEPSIYNRALSADEIAALYHAGSAGKCLPHTPQGKALAHWKFDETSGSVAHDSVGSYDGVLSTTGVSFVSNGIAGNAIRLARSANGSVNMGDVLPMTSGDFSISAWVKTGAGDSSENLIVVAKHRTWFNNGYFLSVNHSGILGQDSKALFFSGDQYRVPVSTTTVNDGNWHHLVAVHEVGGNCLIYVDGTPSEDSSPSLPVIASPAPLLVGGVDDLGTVKGLFNGLIDDLQIYSYALTPTNVDFLFQNPGLEIAAHELPVGDWQLNTFAGTGGTVGRSPDLAKYTNGAVVQATALPNAGFVFTGWSGDATGNSNPIAITMTGNKTVTASFREIPARVLAVVNPEARQEGLRVDVPLRLVSQGEVGGMSFVLHYNPDYLGDPELTWSSVVGSALDQVNYDVAGRVWATFALPATAVPAGTQSVASISFRTRSVPFTLTTELPLEVLDVSSPSGNPIVSGTEAVGGAARILLRRVIGDNNANDQLDVGDATIMQRLLTGLTPKRSWDVTENDVNQNLNLDSGDVIRVLRAVVELDPQPAPHSANEAASRLAKAGPEKAGPTSGSSSGLAILLADRVRGQPGDLVTVQVLLKDIATRIAGASFALDYPTNALRQLNSQSHRAGSLVPDGAVAVWNVQPAQNDYSVQSGRVPFGVSSATQWPTNNGVLAEFTFQVQSGQTAQYRWPIRLTGVELTADGYDILQLPDAQISFIGRAPNPPSLGADAAGVSKDGFHLVLGGEVGMAYTIEVSTDLVHWSAVSTVTTATGVLNFVDTEAKNSGQRFYRATQQF